MSERPTREEPWNETLIEQTVTYHIEMEGRLVLVENVPARVNVETGERHFSPETVERLGTASGMGTMSTGSCDRNPSILSTRR